MYLNIDQKIFEQQPDLKVGVILLKGINNTRRVSSVESLLRGISAQREKEFRGKEVFDIPEVQVWSNAYGKFGINPRKYMPSIAALLKRVQKGKEIAHINILVDLYNYFSLKYLLPIGGEDIDWLCGDINLTFTKGGESFRAIGSIEVEKAKEGEAAYIDEGGITCRYWNHRECERSKFTPKTQNAVLLIEDLTKMHMDKFGKILNDIQINIEKYIGGEVETYTLNEENRVVNLGVEGRKNVDDSKIPKQEMAYFLKEKSKNEEATTAEAPEIREAKKKVRGQDQSNKVSSESKLVLEDKNLYKVRIKELLEDAVKKAFPKTDCEVSIEYPAIAEHGDYSCNIALNLTKALKKSPQEIAQKIVAEILGNSIIDKVEIAGPGFINIFLSDRVLNDEIQEIVKEKDSYAEMAVGEQQSVIVEYSQPNIAKPLGVHHLLSTIIGQSIYNIFKKLGFEAISINHTGDWGTQFGKLIYAYRQWGNKETVEKDPINELLKLYVKFHDEAEKDLSLEDKGREEFKKFEEGDQENHKLWEWFVDESLKEINKTYDLLGGIHFDHMHPESFYADKMQAILEKGKEMKIFTEGEEGALVAKFDDPNIPTLPVIKKDGSTLYITRDFAALNYRLKTFNPVRILYVVDIAQTLHFKQLFAVAKKFGWEIEKAFHVWFGRMHLKDGSASTRKGNVVLLDEVLKEAISRAAKVIEEKSHDLKDKDKVARIIGIGAVKYSVLSQNRTSDITFDWDRMLSLDGNSAPYLQYSYARAKSILRKASEKQEGTINESEECEKKIKALIRMFPKFKEQIASAAKEYKPNIISNYLYELAQSFNSFYNTVPVLKAEKESDKEKRLEIVEAAAQVLKNGLALLGVEVVEEM